MDEIFAILFPILRFLQDDSIPVMGSQTSGPASADVVDVKLKKAGPDVYSFTVIWMKNVNTMLMRGGSSDRRVRPWNQRPDTLSLYMSSYSRGRPLA